MNIWFDTTLFCQRPTSNQSTRCPEDTCPKDAADEKPGCTPPSTSLSILAIANIAKESIRYLYADTFIHAENVYIQKFDDSRWLVCNLMGSGKVAVLDTEMHALFMCFHSRKRLQEVAEAVSEPYISPSKVAKAIALFIHLDLLVDLNRSVSTFNQEQSQTLSAWLHVTNACNLRCHYCYVQKTSDSMADDTSKRAVDALIRSATSYRYKHIHLTYAGGEATLQLPQVLATHDYALQQTQAHGLGLSASLLSNGVALPPRFVDQLKQHQIRLMISLDGVGEDHDQQRPLVNGKGSFTLVDRTINRLLAKQLVPYINVTVTQRNLNNLSKVIEYVLQRDLPFGLSYYRENECSSHLSDLQFTDTHMINGMRTAFAYLEHHLPRRSLLDSLVDKASMHGARQYTCGVGRNYLVIDQRGGIAKCQADIRQVVTTIDAENPLRIIREHTEGVQAVPIENKEGCRTCEWRFWCTGGCPMLTYRLTGRSDIRSPNCAIYKALFPDVLRLEALRLLKYESPVSF